MFAEIIHKNEQNFIPTKSRKNSKVIFLTHNDLSSEQTPKMRKELKLRLPGYKTSNTENCLKYSKISIFCMKGPKTLMSPKLLELYKIPGNLSAALY